MEENVVTKSDVDVDVMSLEGPTVYVNLGEYGSGELTRDADGNYSGDLISRSGYTTITCTMTGYINSIENLFEIGLHWNGTNQVNYISATSLTIKSASVFSSDVYWSNPISFPAGSTTKGYYPVGYVAIDPNVSMVRVESSGLQAYFNNEDFWIRLNEIYGNIKLNDF
ncbi:MAG: hypothetical protein HDR12_07700 [Lachnospiraceae bacterium]|nr:hypothetical protein [Lachnospiraceae bacterium]